MPFASLLARYQASIVESSFGSAAPVATDFAVMPLPLFLIVFIAPSMRGWMFSDPGVAMKRATLPDPPTRSTMCSPIFWPERNRSWPM